VSNSAERQRRRRTRLRKGIAVRPLPFEVAAMGDWLTEKGFLEAWDAEDPDKVFEALMTALDVWCHA
jgi:hypothetical protein